MNLGGRENCITVFDTDLNELSAFNIGNPTNGSPKGVGLAIECCPDPNIQVIDVDACEPAGDILLNEQFPCAGTVCEAEWVPADAISASFFDSCKQSISELAPEGCYSYTKISDGIDINARCGAFSVTLNICKTIQFNPPQISITDNTCDPNVSGSINVDVPCANGSTIEFSTDGGLTWSTTQPVYDTTSSFEDMVMPVTVRARCVNNNNNTCISEETADVTSIPEQCCPVQNCISRYGQFTINKRIP